MTDRELGRALLELDAAAISGKSDVSAKTEQILARDRFRLGILTWGVVAVWSAALCVVFFVLVWFALLFPAQAKLIQETDAALRPAAELQQIQRDLVISFHMGTLLIAFSVFLATLAAFLTVLLIFATRRATLRQVNANLAEICTQLKAMRQAK